jgi:2-polyprenyl-6-hydroxyphenyl methylase/3-demethylubiquinone-9 3-methyltransferase
MRFAFGKNWQSFVDTALNSQRIGKAAGSLRRLLGVDHLRGRTFLDIGCGSGLFSLAACMLGADRVVAFDYDQDSVQASIAVRARAGISAERWRIEQGSILDRTFLDMLDSADVVYSWGVLHHTGAMWQAIDHAAGKISPGGQFALALYNDVQRALGGSRMWWHVKQAYNAAPQPVKRLMEQGYGAAFLLKDAANMRNPLRTVKEYSHDSGRGMDFWHDARDWLGGFPYEYATPAAVFNHLHATFGLQLEYLSTSGGVGCNEFTFRKPPAG